MLRAGAQREETALVIAFGWDAAIFVRYEIEAAEVVDLDSIDVLFFKSSRRLGDGCLQRSDGLAIAAPNDFLATDEEAALHMRVELRR